MWCSRKMHVIFVVLLTATWIFAEQNEDRRSKLPYIADAVGNSLPPPSNVPATVGSPVNLLTPDRYEFYTFDESGELVKRLMTLEEIQAIVAAGEETEGLVTFANENQPTVAFNFSQPSHTKVHNVVTNVQNVLKAQMEAHKKKPAVQPTLDTPDVSDSWSLILPSIFGNSGIDIVPDKNTESFITPETDTIDIDNTQGKENVPITNESTQIAEATSKPPQQIESTTTTTVKPPSSTATSKPPSSTTTSKPPSSTTTSKPPSSTKKLIISTTVTSKQPSTTKKGYFSTTALPKLSTSTPKRTVVTRPSINSKLTTTTTTTQIPLLTSTSNNKPYKLSNNESSTKLNVSLTTENKLKNTSNEIISSTHKIFTKNNTLQLEKISTFIPITNAAYVTDKTPLVVTTPKFESFSAKTSSNIINEIVSVNVTSESPSKINNNTVESSLSPLLSTDEEFDKINSTTMTTQSVSPSTTLSSTEFTLTKNDHDQNSQQNNFPLGSSDTKVEPIIPLFDVALSISQIASDLGGSFSPVPTTNNLIDTNKINNLPIESKENVEIDIPTESGIEEPKNVSNFENYVKITTFDPQESNKNNIEPVKQLVSLENNKPIDEASTKMSIKTSTTPYTSTTSSNNVMDPVLSESMGDMISQVMNENSQSPTTTEKNNYFEDNNATTMNVVDGTTKSGDFSTTNKEIENEDVKTFNITGSKINGTNTLSISNNNETNIFGNKVRPTEIIISKYPYKQDFNKTETFVNPIQNKYQIGKNENELKKPSHEIMKNSIKSEFSNRNKLMNKTESNVPFSSNLNVNTSDVTNKINYIISNTTLTKDKPLDEFKKKIQKVNLDDKDLGNERNNSWKLVPVVPPPKNFETEKDNHKTGILKIPDNIADKQIILDFSKENHGLEVTIKGLGEDILQFTDLCNELAFRYWNELVRNIDNKRSFVLSPYSVTSMLAMMFMGARGGTSGEMNDVLKLDDMVTFNPHFTLKNISDSITTSSSSGVAVSAFIRELFSEKSKGKILTFYKERAQHFYNGHVEEINFKLISDIIRRRTNLLVKRYTWGKIPEYIKSNSISMNPPLAAFAANIFETDCTGSSVEGRDGEMYFVVSPTVRQRRLVPVPAVVYKSNFLAGYDPVLDATAAALGNTNSVVSTLFLMPGQQGNVVHSEDLEALEKRLLGSIPTIKSWNQLLRTLLPRPGLELQIPRFSHKSIFNVTSALQKMGLKELFDVDHADLAGLNGPSKNLHLSDMIQLTNFVTCGEGLIGEQHHIEEYPEVLQLRRRNSRWATIWDEPRDYQRAFHDPHDVGDAMHLPLHLRPRQARLPTRSSQPARLKFDRPFLFFVRHNPSGMILYVGRYNPRLLP